MRTVEIEGRWYVYDGDVRRRGPFESEAEAVAWIGSQGSHDRPVDN